MQITIQNLLEHSDFKCFRAAYSIAQEAHKNQKRKSGDPYMTHINAVIDGLIEAYSSSYSSKKRGSLIEVYEKRVERPYKDSISYFDEMFSVAALHDVYEDHKDKFSLKLIRDIFSARAIEDEQINAILEGVYAISKKPKGEEDYWKYVKRVEGNRYAHMVKIHDLKHNMSDLEPGNMLDKYSLTLAVLEGEFNYE